MSDAGEKAPLLPTRTDNVQVIDQRSWFRTEFVRVFNFAWSLFLIAFFTMVLQPVALFFCARLGRNALAAAAMSTSLFNVTGLAVGLGLATACDTVFSQSITSRNKTETGVYLIKSTIIILLFSCPCSALHINTESILLSLGQSPCVARLSGQYMQYLTISLPAAFLQEILMQYLRCQDYLLVPLMVGLLSVGVCILAHYLLVFVLDYGLLGSAMAMVATFYIMALVLVLYIVVSGVYKASWRGWTMDILQNWGDFVKLALAGFVMFAVEWWIWEFSVITSGWFGTADLSAASIVLQVMNAEFQIPFGIALAVNIRVGQLLGARDSLTAAKIVYIGSLMNVVQGSIVALTLILLRYRVAQIFTEDGDVARLCAEVLPIGCLIMLMEGQCSVLKGVLRGCGRHVTASIVMVLGLVVVGLPIALVLQLVVNLATPGFYYGIAVGITVKLLLLIVVTYRTDWRRMVDDAQIRAGVHKLYEGGDLPRDEVEFGVNHREVSGDLSISRLILRRTLFTIALLGTLAAGLYFRMTTQHSNVDNPCSSNHSTTASPLW